MKKEPSTTKENLRPPRASLRLGFTWLRRRLVIWGISQRVRLKHFRRADLVLCEDTRVTGQLLRHFGLSCPLAVYNDHSEHASHAHVIAQIKEGRAIALVSDAGMPLISDPGYQLFRRVTWRRFM
jgi:16S rRNA C1402 (ribose-2'-O) methylase RsmI